MADLQLISFSFTNYFALIMNNRPFQPITTILIKIVMSLIDSEPIPEDINSNEYKIFKKNKDRVLWLYENTHENIKMPLTTIEFMTFRNLEKSPDKELNINDDQFKVIDLYHYLDHVTLELTNIVVSIAKKYSFEIPVQAYGRTNAPANL